MSEMLVLKKKSYGSPVGRLQYKLALKTSSKSGLQSRGKFLHLDLKCLNLGPSSGSKGPPIQVDTNVILHEKMARVSYSQFEYL